MAGRLGKPGIRASPRLRLKLEDPGQEDRIRKIAPPRGS